MAVWSSAMLVITLKSGLTTLVESSRPPSPVSTTATSTPQARNQQKAIAVVISKKEKLCAVKKSRWRSTKSATNSLGIISPSTRIRSRKSIRCGEVYNPVRYPASISTEASMLEVEPFPLVPATWMQRSPRSGWPR